MAKMNVSLKHLQVDKANSAVVVAVSVAAFVLVFAGFSAKALLDQRSYQARVIDKKSAALEQIKQNKEAVDSLRTTYAAFVTNPQNIIGGASNGAGEKDGDNARIVLDALPSSYDFPALVTSLEKILNAENVVIDTIAGTDDELTQGASGDDSSPQDTFPIEIPFRVEVAGDYTAVQELTDTFERSIRPFHIETMALSGTDGSMKLEIGAKTYYQPEKVFKVGSEVVR